MAVSEGMGPAAFRVRPAGPADAAAMARVHVDSWRTTYRGIVPDAHLARLSYERREQIWRDLTGAPEPDYRAFVAEEVAGRVVGLADGGRERSGDPIFVGELYSIYLLASHQRRGIGRRLMQAVARHLADRGLHALLLWTLPENPACRFYEALGGQQVSARPVVIGGLSLIEVAYGWTDTAPLLEPRGL